MFAAQYARIVYDVLMLTSLAIYETLDFPDSSYNECVYDVHVRSRSLQNNNMLQRRFIIIIIIIF